MSVDAESRRDGRTHITLGPVEKAIVSLASAALVAALTWFANKVDKQGEQINRLVTQQAVANGSLQAITAQLTDVPQLRRDVVELKVRVDAVEESQKELRQTRGLK